MHIQASEWLEKLSVYCGDLGHVLEIGSADYNGTARTFLQKLSISWTGIDIIAKNGVDIVVDITDEETRDKFIIESITRNKDFYHTIVCTEVLEHINPRLILNAALDCLEPDFGGTLIITCAGENRIPHSADGGPLNSTEYYKNLMPSDLVFIIYDLLTNELVPRSATVKVEWNLESQDVYMFVRIHALPF